MSTFVTYATTGRLPDGTQTSLPIMAMEEISLLLTPQHRWAEDLSDVDTTRLDALSPLFGAPYEGTDLEVSPCADFQAKLLPLKARMWQGMAPMSRDRWLQRKMDDPANYRNLMELMTSILTIFRWWNLESTHDSMRAGFNFMVDKHVEWAVPVNDLRAQNGVTEKLDLAAMWAEYFHARISVMSERTHQWLVDRVDEVQTSAFAEYNDAIKAAGNDQDAIGIAGKRYYGCVQDLSAMITKADYTLNIPTTGFRGHTPSDNISDQPFEVRYETYHELAEIEQWPCLKKMLAAQESEAEIDKQLAPKDMLDMLSHAKKPPPAAPRFRDSETLIGHYHEGRRNRAETRAAFRGPPAPTTLSARFMGSLQAMMGAAPKTEEYWIGNLKTLMDFYLENGRDRKTHRWGFACYRLTYNQTDAEWAEFVKKLEADMHNPIGGEWIDGFESISDMAGLEIHDGRKLGIAEGDVEAAKEHFEKTYTMLPTLGRMWAQNFLVIDAQSYDSYAHLEPELERPPPPFGPCFGDNGGYVRLVDTLEYPQEMLDEISPGYSGEMKVLSSLVFTEVYPLLATNALKTTGLWPLARLHPREVYVGHTNDSQEAWWEFGRIDVGAMMGGMFADMRRKKAAMLRKEG
jgi:hypothetical protein